MGPTEKQKVKVNLYDPHQEPRKEISPGPGDYFGGLPQKRVKTASSARNTTIYTKVHKPSVRRNTFHNNAKSTHYSMYPNTINYDQNKIKYASSMFLLSNKDRFGHPIQSTKPLENKPPPGAYNITQNTAAVTTNKRVKHALIYKPSARPLTKFKAPGPAYYKPNSEPKIISHHLNVQNTWMC